MTDPFDTVREALEILRETREFDLAAMSRYTAALASIEERLRVAERLLEIEQERGVVRRIRAEAAEARIAEAVETAQEWELIAAQLQHIIDCADTPLMRDVLARVVELEKSLARALEETQQPKEA